MSFFEEFKKFAMRGNVIDLAVGVVIGGAFGKITSSLVDNIIMPPLSLLFGKVDFSGLFISLNGQIIALPVKPENPLRTAEMTLEDDYGMIDGVLNNGRKGEELEKAQGEARRTTPEKKPSIRERLAEAKRECGERKPPDKTQQKKPPEHDL